jgi:hypothetical protein
MGVYTSKHAIWPFHCIFFELHDSNGEVSKELFLRFGMLFLLDSSSLILRHVAVLRGDNLSSISISVLFLLAANISHL